MDDAELAAEAEAVARAAHEAIADLDLDALRELLDDSVVWRGAGDDDAGPHHGREAVIQAVARQHQPGPRRLVDVVAEPEPEVVGFSLATLGPGATYVTTRIEVDTVDGTRHVHGYVVVAEARIVELGTIGEG